MDKTKIKSMALTFAKVFSYVILGFVLKNKSFIGVDWPEAIDAAGVAVVAILINYVDPNYKMYGKQN